MKDLVGVFNILNMTFQVNSHQNIVHYFMQDLTRAFKILNGQRWSL